MKTYREHRTEEIKTLKGNRPKLVSKRTRLKLNILIKRVLMSELELE